MSGLYHIESLILILGNLIAIALLYRHNPLTIIIIGYVELLDVFLTKYNSLISAQVIEPFKGFAQAYIEPRLNYSYAPSLFEIFVAACLLVAVVVVFYFLYKIFPLTKEA